MFFDQNGKKLVQRQHMDQKLSERFVIGVRDKGRYEIIGAVRMAAHAVL